MDRALLHHAWRLADEAFRPHATDADRGDTSGHVSRNIRALGEAGLFGLGIGREYGGHGADEVTKHEYAEILASSCGVTAFTQQQLQMGIKFLVESDNRPLQQELLPALAAGRQFCGIALSQLRRSGPPLLRASLARGGYRLNGSMPWITGWSLLDGFVVGAAIEDGSHLLAYVDRARHAEALTASAPLPLIVMAASDTVEVEVRDLFLSDDVVLRLQPAEELRRHDQKTLTTHAALPLGCARAGVRHLRELAQKPGREAIGETAVALTFEIDQCRREALTWNCECVDHPEYLTYALRARASAIVLGMRAAYAAVVATGGRAHLTTSTPQRLLREAQFYATAVQTPEIQAGTLDQLISPFFGL